jgi:hypothetical protein
MEVSDTQGTSNDTRVSTMFNEWQMQNSQYINWTKKKNEV